MADPRETVVYGTQGQGPAGGGDLTEELVHTSTWTDEMVDAAGIPVVDAPFVSVGGGMGSLAMVDYLRIAGVAADDIAVLSADDAPHEQYATLCANSQIPGHERLRSDSWSTPDNVWGFPGYALREAWHDRTLRPLLHVLVEPVLRPYWTPRAGDVFAAVAREAARIGWSRCRHKGQVRMVRPRRAGGYITILTPEAADAPKRVAFRSRYVHLAVGYPALRFLPDLEKYRETHGDYTRVVNAYEPHEHVYEALQRKPGVVMVRGAGIVASRILQRLIDDRDATGAQTVIRHLFRTYRTTPKQDRRFGWGKQPVAHGWAHQGFNVTKASWGGQHRDQLLALDDPEERAAFHDYVGGGAHTPVRRDWTEQLARGRAEGFYRQHVGEVEDVQPGDDGASVVTAVRDGEGHLTHIPADYVIDCTGLIGGAREHRLLADLLDHAGARLNRSGRLACEEHHEVTGTASPPGKLYASGAASAGNLYAGVDSFLGLQYVAQRIADDLAAEGFCRRIGPWRSTRQWLKWARNEPL